jgi:hypothetical protein
VSSAAADLAQYLIDQGLGSGGVDMFEGPPPDEVDNAVGVVHFGGEPADYVMGPSLSVSSEEVAHVTVLVRNTSLAAARAKAAAIHAKLENLQAFTGSSGARYLAAASLDGEPHLIPARDEGDRFRYSCDYRVEKTRG